MRLRALLALLVLGAAAAAGASYWAPGAGAQGEPNAPKPLKPTFGEEYGPAPQPVKPADESEPPLAAIRPHAELKPADLDLGSAQDLNDEKAPKGEMLDYEILWNGIPAGRSIMGVRKRASYPDKNGPEVWEIRMDTRSTRLVGNFFPVKDKVITSIDVKGGFSRYYYLNQREGAYKGEERIRVDYTAAKMEAVCGRTRLDDTIGYLTIPLSGKVLDPLSAIYYLRAIDFGENLKVREELAADAESGKLARQDYEKRLRDARILLPICTERRVWDTEIVPVAREYLDLKCIGKKQACILIVPKCEFNGIFQRRGEMRIWLHEATRVLVRMEVELPIGACEIRLAGHAYSPLDKGK